MALSTSCVSKIYNDLESKYTDLKKENRSLADDNSALVKLKPIRIRSRWFKNGCKQCCSSISKGKQVCSSSGSIKTLQSSYNALEKTVTMRYKAT
jgi:chemotaxis protein MotB